ncbi:MAG: CHAP domain-containing protein [Sandaracinus sp.]|nr:CHAP domain-containing protein [Sandaracinus sp.]
MRRLALACLLASLAPTDVVHADDPCAHVTCSSHGACFSEGERAYCLCEEGFSAVGGTCVRRRTVKRDDHAGLRVVHVARGEVDRTLPFVGSERRLAPGPLGPHVPSGDLWCTDFVAWVYAVAGAPLSGGDDGGWLIRTNAAMRRWFERRGLFVAKSGSDFARFEPRPGDYVRIRNDTWGHSALVDHVEGDTLFLVEGNAGGKVRATRYPQWREHPRIDGFGIASFTRARRRRLGAPLGWLMPLARR